MSGKCFIEGHTAVRCDITIDISHCTLCVYLIYHTIKIFNGKILASYNHCNAITFQICLDWNLLWEPFIIYSSQSEYCSRHNVFTMIFWHFQSIPVRAIAFTFFLLSLHSVWKTNTLYTLVHIKWNICFWSFNNMGRNLPIKMLHKKT